MKVNALREIEKFMDELYDIVAHSGMQQDAIQTERGNEQ